jgi:orotate phosphoribosyltransferase
MRGSQVNSEPVSGRLALAESLFRIGALRFGKFTLSSGRPSSYYLDLRVVPSYPDAYALELEAFRAVTEEIGKENFDVVAGVATAGVVISSPLAFLLKKPMIYVRKEEKGHGLDRMVEGAARPRWRALVVDDVITTGGSIIGAVDALRKGGCVVKDAVVLVDRLEGGKANLAAHAVRLSSFLDVRELVGSLHARKMITKRDYEAVMKQVEDSAA